jgi:hypothetical protein
MSSYHKKVGELLKSSIFKHYKIVEEYPVYKINPDWYSRRHRFDWVIKDLFVVIEVHGEQHYSTVRWSKETCQDEADAKLESNQANDHRKQQAALDAGYTYISIPHWDVTALTAHQLLARVLLSSDTSATIRNKRSEPRSPAKLKELARARNIRRSRYLSQKEWLRQRKLKEAHE